MNNSSRGIIYIVTGQKYVDEAFQSAASVRKWMPDVPITLFSDKPTCLHHFDQVVAIADPKYGLEDEIVNMRRTPYSHTLYLDSDTHMVADCRELFALLERFDCAAVLSAFRAQYQLIEVPDCFPEFNTGVLLFRKSAQMDQVMEGWGNIYRDDSNTPQKWVLPDISN